MRNRIIKGIQWEKRSCVHINSGFLCYTWHLQHALRERHRESPLLFPAYHIHLLLNNLSTVCKFQFRVCISVATCSAQLHNYNVCICMRTSNQLRILLLSLCFSLSWFHIFANAKKAKPKRVVLKSCI